MSFCQMEEIGKNKMQISKRAHLLCGLQFSRSGRGSDENGHKCPYPTQCMNTILQKPLKSKHIWLFLRFLSIMPIFMSTSLCQLPQPFPACHLPKTIVLPYIAQASVTKTLNIDYAGFLSFSTREVNIIYLPSFFVQLNQFSISPSLGSARVFV